MTIPALKPCPFCGSAATLEDERLLWVARCTGCGACVLGDRAPDPEQEMPSAYWESFKQSAVDRWNRQAASPTPDPETLAEARPAAPSAPEVEERPNKRDVNRWLLALPPHGTSIEELSGIVLKALAHWRDRPASLPAPKMGLPGLHGKYIVWKSADRSPVKYPCFVLRVDGRDDAAMAAIQAYAAHPDCPPELAADLAQAIRQNATVDLRRATSPPAPL